MSQNGTLPADLAAEIRARHRLPPPATRRAIRIDAGVSQGRLGEIVGVSDASIAYYESGDRQPRGAHLVRYVEALEQLREMTR